VKLDVITGRIVSLRPQPVFIPIFREVDLLDEREFGVFVPNWIPETDIQKVIAIPQTEPFTSPTNSMEASPFISQLPIAGDDNARMSPGISEALRKCKPSQDQPTWVTQICLPGQSPLPADLHKWQSAKDRIITLDDLSKSEPASTDVMVMRLGLWQNLLNSTQGLGLDALTNIAQQLKPGGVLYWVDVLPLELPAHWVFHFFPKAWEWVRIHSKSMHAVNKSLLTDFKTQIKSHVSYQPVQLDTALSIAERREGLLAKLTDEVYVDGLTRLGQVVTDKGVNDLVASEVGYLEVWAQKR
jgi:hypothetical protein